MAKRSSLTNIAIRNQVYLERVKTAEAMQYNKLLAILQKQVNETLATLDTPVQQLTRARLNALLRELRAAQQAALTKSQDSLLRRLQKIAAYESSFEVDSINAVTPRGITIAPIKEAVTWNAVTTTPMLEGELLEPFVREMTGREVATINKTILRGWSEGWTNDEITRALRGTKKQNYKDGLMNRMGKHNATLVRTSVQHAANAARQEVWNENDDIISGYRWVSTLDGRTTSQCRSLDGQEFEVGKGPQPPLHMNCRSITVAVIHGLEELSDALTRASKDGQVAGNMTYYEWLKTQDEAFQNSVLGEARAKLFRDGGLSAERFAELQLNSYFKPMTLEEMKKVAPAAFSRAGI